MSVKIEHNFDIKAKQLQKYVNKLKGQYLNSAMYYVLNEVGNVAVAEYMIATSNMEMALTQPTHPTKLTIRTGRLARSILEAPSFNRGGLPTDFITDVLTQKPNVRGEEGQEGFKRVLKNGLRVEGIIGTDVPYAEKHESEDQRPYLLPAAKDVTRPGGVGESIFERTIEQTFKRADI